MGIYDRDYYRETESGWFNSGSGWSMTTILIFITVATFLLQLMLREAANQIDPLTKWGAFRATDILNGEIWRLITPLFLHSTSSLFHIAFNMIMLYFLGNALEEVYGPKEFLAFYLTAGLFVSLGKLVLFLVKVEPAEVISIGASGSILASLIVYALHFPYRQVLLMFIIPMPVWLVAVLVVALNLFGFIGGVKDGIGYTGHLLGILFGAIYFQSGIRITGYFTDIFQVFSRKPQLKVYQPTSQQVPVGVGNQSSTATPAQPAVDEHLEAKLDEILSKVAEHGRDSLTAEENQILMQASEIFKKKRRE